MLALLIAALLPVVAPTAAPSEKVAVLPLSPGEGVTEKVAAAVTEAAAGEIRRVPGVQMITQQEISTLLGFDRQRALLSCQQDSCVAEVGGALGVDRLAFGSLARLGESWLLSIKLMDVKKARVLSQADRRIRKGSIDDVLDALPGAVKELFAAAPSAVRPAAQPEPQPPVQPAVAPEPQPQPAAAVVPAAEKKPLPPRWAEKEMDLGASRAKLKLATNGKGFYVAYTPYGDGDDRLFAGDGKQFFAQRVAGAGRDEVSFDYTIWEPRVRERWQASFEVREGKPKLHCGKEPTELATVPDAEAKKLIAKARFFEPRWQRRAHALARDDIGTYYFVEQAREPEDNRDFRLYIGEKGQLEPLEVTDAIIDDGGELFATAAGRLKLSREKAEWIKGQVRTPLIPLDLYQNAVLIYTDLRVYAGERLGTLCDWAFP